MKFAFRSYVTAGIALVGAGAIVVTPEGPPTPDIQVRAVQLTAGDTIGLVIGGSGTPIPGPGYVDAANNLYIHPIYPDTTYPGVLANGLFTPEGLYPLDGVKVLELNYPLDANGFPAQSTSVGQGVTILDNNIASNIAAGDTSTVFGYSQSATIASIEMQQTLDPSGTPSDLPVQFLLIGDPSAPNGGVLERFAGYETTAGDTHSLPLTLPSVGFNFDSATPADDFQTSIYSLEYDGFTDFPRYPLNFLADLNAFLGIKTLHGTYLNGGVDGSGPTAQDIADAKLLPGSEALGTPDSLTNYYEIDTLDGDPVTPPLVALLPKALQDLLGPDLTYLINLGYGDGSLGYSDAPANVPTPFGLFPDVSLTTVLQELDTKTQDGFQAFEADMANPAAWVSPTASLALPSATTAADPASFTDIVNAFSSAASSAYATLLPTADILNALTTSLPAYDLNLFTDNLQTGDLLDAFGLPVAANTALYTLAAGFEVQIITNAISDITAAFAGTGL
jgi:hypothetical protein